jgi:hypothetical protein
MAYEINQGVGSPGTVKTFVLLGLTPNPDGGGGGGGAAPVPGMPAPVILVVMG